MVKLTAELIEQAAQYTNAVRDRELDLRGESEERASGPLVRAPPPRVQKAGARPPRGCTTMGPKLGGLHKRSFPTYFLRVSFHRLIVPFYQHPW